MRWKVFGVAAFMLAVWAATMLAQPNPPESPEFPSDVERRAWMLDCSNRCTDEDCAERASEQRFALAGVFVPTTLGHIYAE